MCGSLVRGFRPHHVWRRRRSRCACILTCLWEGGNGGFRRRDRIGTKGHVGGRSWVLLMALLGKVGRKGWVLTGLMLGRVGGRRFRDDPVVCIDGSGSHPGQFLSREETCWRKELGPPHALSAHLAQQSHEEDPAPSSNMSLRADPVPPAKATISDIPEASQD